MDRESIIELQKLDCNCNDCIFLVRDQVRFKESLESHRKWQLDYFNTVKQNLLNKADKYHTEFKTQSIYSQRNHKYDPKKGDNLIREAAKLKFQFNKKECSINYGHCDKLDKDVEFLPNTLQFETQDCFKHRREE
jgi:hypothetical protein